MKKYLPVFMVVIIIIVIWLSTPAEKVRIQNNTGTVRFIYKDVSIEASLSDTHANRISSMLNGKKVYADKSLSCPFWDDICFIIDGQTFCIATDSCPIIYIPEKEKYLYLDNTENKILRDILISYGFQFPCI